MRREKIIANLYRDSIALMELSARISKLPGIKRATAVMATQGNIALLLEAGLLAAQMTPRPNDILIVIESTDESSVAAAFKDVESSLQETSKPTDAINGARLIRPSSLQMGLEDMPDANLALISTPGEYAAAEAEKALRLDLSTMVFSSNVAVQDEIDLKHLAEERGLLLMGPDCGSAVVNGIPLGFANVLRRGPVGMVASAGTGLQQVTCLIDRAGVGISHALGCGGRDLSDEVGGSSMLKGLTMLDEDASTEVIVLVAKHPDTRTAQHVIKAAARVSKPVIVNFLGFDAGKKSIGNIYFAETLEDAAQVAVMLAQGLRGSALKGAQDSRPVTQAGQATTCLTARRKYIRGLFAGGTFCYEAQLLLGREVGRVWSNAPTRPTDVVPDRWVSHEHTVIDLGDEVFTRGRPHPMIDQRLRLERLAQEVRDPETAVILFDVVLGYGAHQNPASEIAEAIAVATRAVEEHPVFVASICGTDKDPQNLQQQESTLRNAGVLVEQSNAAAVRRAAAIAVAQKDAR